jgi:predicted nucleic acid-binding protein
MRDELVLDVSVAAKGFFEEVGSAMADQLLQSGARLIAPDLIHVEMASIAAKHVRRRGVPHEVARRAMAGLRAMLSESVPLGALAEEAFDLAAKHGFSAYDGTYLALARTRGLVVITADVKFARKAAEAGLADHITLLAMEG